MEEQSDEEQKASLVKIQKENLEEDEGRAKEGEMPLLERVSSAFQTSEDELEETLEETVVEANEGHMLTMDTNHPPRSQKHVSLFLTFG